MKYLDYLKKEYGNEAESILKSYIGKQGFATMVGQGKMKLGKNKLGIVNGYSKKLKELKT